MPFIGLHYTTNAVGTVTLPANFNPSGARIICIGAGGSGSSGNSSTGGDGGSGGVWAEISGTNSGMLPSTQYTCRAGVGGPQTAGSRTGNVGTVGGDTWFNCFGTAAGGTGIPTTSTPGTSAFGVLGAGGLGGSYNTAATIYRGGATTDGGVGTLGSATAGLGYYQDGSIGTTIYPGGGHGQGLFGASHGGGGGGAGGPPTAATGNIASGSGGNSAGGGAGGLFGSTGISSFSGGNGANFSLTGYVVDTQPLAVSGGIIAWANTTQLGLGAGGGGSGGYTNSTGTGSASNGGGGGNPVNTTTAFAGGGGGGGGGTGSSNAASLGGIGGPGGHGLIIITYNVATYAVAAAGSATSVNEGSSLTFNVTTTNVVNTTILYWRINHSTTSAADFSASSGSFTITTNAGSFSVSPLADSLTEGAETFTVSVSLASGSTAVATSSTITVNDTSTAAVTPTVTSVAATTGGATSGTTFGGTPVTITGTNFTSGSINVTFAGVVATSIVFVSATSITCVTPAQAATGTNGAVTVAVTATGGTGNGTWTYTTPAPTTGQIGPSAGSLFAIWGGVAGGGNTVTITGTNFTQTGLSVAFGATNSGSVTRVSNTELSCTVPIGTAATTVNITVSNPGGASPATLPTYRYLGANRYWVGTTGNWGTTTSNWSDASGGTGYNTFAAPTSLTDVFFDSSVPVVTISSATCRTLTISVAITLASSSTNVAIFGGLAVTATITNSSYTGAFVFSATSSSFTFASTSSLYALTFSGAGGTFTQSGTITCTSVITITAATTVAFNNSVTCQRYVVSGASATVTYTSATFTITGFNLGATAIIDGAILTNYTGSTGLTASTFNCNYSGATGTRTIVWGTTGGSEGKSLPVNITAGGDIVTFTAGSHVKSLNFTGFTGLASNGWSTTGISLYGDLTIPSGTIISGTGLITFSHTSGTATITSGTTYPGGITQNSTGATVALGSNVTISASQTYTLTAGTLNLSTFVLSTGIFSSSNTNTRAITFSGGGYIACSGPGSGTVFGAGTNLIDMVTLTGMTYNGSSRFDYTAATGSGGTSRDIGASGTPYGTTGGSTSLLLNVNITAGSDNINVRATNFFGSLIFQSGFSGRATANGGTLVMYGSLTTSVNMLWIQGTTIFQWSHTSGTVDWTSNGKPWGFRPTISGTGGTVRLVDDVNIVNFTPPYMSTNGTSTYATSTCGMNNIGTGDFTIEFWWSVTTGDKFIFSIYSATAAKALSIGYATSTSTLYVSNDVIQVTSASLASLVGFWVHVAYVRTSGSCKLYINGTQSGSTYSPDTHNYDTGTDIFVGKAGGGAVYYTVALSNLRITQAAVYTGNFTPNSDQTLSRFQSAKTNTIALYGTETRLLTFQNYDSLGNGYDNSINNYFITYNSAAQFDASLYCDVTLTAGTLNLNDKILTIRGTFSSDNSNVRSINTGTNGLGYIRIINPKAGTITVWSAATLTNFTTTGLLSVHLDQGPVNSGGADENKTINHGGTAGGTSSNAINLFPYVGTGIVAFLGGYTITGVFNDLAFNWAPLYSMSFNGTTQYLTVTDATAFDQDTDFTWECWIYPTAYPGSFNAAIMAAMDQTGAIGFRLNTTGKIVVDDQQFGDIITSVATVSLNNWAHVALVRNGATTNNVNLFINGLLDTTASYSSWQSAQTKLYIGIRTDTSTYFSGYISNVRVVKGVAVYKQIDEPSSSTSSITMSYNFTSNIATAVINNITIVGNPGSGTSGGTGSVTGTSSTLSTSGTVTGGTGTQPYGSSNQNGGLGGGINGASTAWPGNGPGSSTRRDPTLGLDQGTSPNTLFQTYNTALSTSLTSIGNGAAGGTSGGTTDGDAGTFIGGGGGGVGGGYSGALGGAGGNAGIVIQYQITNDATVYAAVINSSGVVSGGGGGVTISAGVATFPSTINSIRVWCIGRGANGTNGNSGFLSQAGGGAGGTGWAVFSSFNNFSLTTTSQSVSATQVKLLTAKSSTIIDTSSYPVLINNIGTVTAGNTTIPFANTYSYQFNGTSQYLTFPGSTNFQFNGDFTIEFYLRVNSIAATQTILDQYRGTTTANGNWKIYVDTAGKINVNYDGSSSFITTSAVIAINTWYHIALHRFNSTFSVYVAGVKQSLTGTTTFSRTFGYIPNNSNDAIWIGAQQLSGPTAYLNGYISNLRIVNGYAVYVTNFTPPSTTLQANQPASGNNIAAISDPASTRLIACHSPRLIDGSVYNLSITNNGTATISSGYVPKFINSSSDETSVGFTGYLKTVASARTIYGSLTLTTAMTLVAANPINFSGSNLQLLSSYNNRSTVSMNWTLNTGASLKLNHNLFYTSLAFFLNYGTLDLNNLTLSCTEFNCTGLFARTLVTGTSGRIITSIFTGSSGTTISGSGTLDVKTTFTGAALSYPIVRAIGNLTVTGANTITTLTNYPTTGIPTLTLPSSTTQTVTSLNVSGNPNRLLYIRSSTSGTAATISDTAGTNNLYYVDVKDITVSGGATFNRDTNTTVANTNITGFTATSLNPTPAVTGNFITFFYGS